MENVEEEKVLKLVTGDLIIGKCSNGENNHVVVENPYTVKDLGQGPCVMPYELDLLMEPMKTLAFPAFNMVWLKNLSNFPEVKKQYTSAVTGLVLDT